MKKSLLLLTIFVLSSLIISAQTPTPTPAPRLDVKPVTDAFSSSDPIGTNYSGIKPISGGVLNGKASTLVRPKYPAAARAVKAEGSVSVQVLIDEKGDVVSASAVSGHPLLRQASEQAARESKFSPTTLQGQPVKVAGIIVYNFVDAKAPKSISEIGFELAILENAQNVPNNISIYDISSNLPDEWTDEKEKLKDFYKKEVPLTESYQASASSNPPPASNDNPAPVQPAVTSGVKTVQGFSVMRRVPSEYSPERAKVGAEIINNIGNRLASNPDMLWKFKTGTVLGKIAAQSENETLIKEAASNLNMLIASAPENISTMTIESLRKLIEIIQTENPSERKKSEIDWRTKALRIL